MTRTSAMVASALLLTVGLLAVPEQGSDTLDIYVIDPEGGKAALFVTPSGETVLIDTGSPGDRDVGRIMDAVEVAGVDRIDYLVSTHYHVDHIGGLQELATRIPVGTYVDHGPTFEGPRVEGQREHVEGFQAAYADLYGEADHIVASPGDTLPIEGLEWTVVTSAFEVLNGPLPGAGQPNAACAGFEPKEDTSDPENGASLGSHVRFGEFSLIDLGDLLWDVEFDLVCPENKVGTVDLYMVSHHGLDSSGSRALVHGIQPRVAIMQNSTRKGGTEQTFDTLQSSPGFEDLWQIHWSHNTLVEKNPAGVFVANLSDAETVADLINPPPPDPDAAPAGRGGRGGRGRGGFGGGGHDPAHYLKISAQADGTFTITNSRNGFSKTYPAE